MLRDEDHMLEYVDDYLHQALSAQDAAALLRHCQTCRICQVAMEEAEARARALNVFSPVEAPEELIRSTLNEISDYDAGAKRLRRITVSSFLGVSAVAALVLLAFNVYFSNLQPSPYNLVVLGQTAWIPDSTASLCVRVFDHDTMDALSDVPVQLAVEGKGSKQPIQLASFRTDRAGFGKAQFHVPDWSDGEYQLRISAQPQGSSEEISRQISLRRSWKLMLSSDKPLYQPSQTIHLRGSALRNPDQKPVAGMEATFSITDPKGNVIFKQRKPTSKFGIAWADCPLATEIIQGQYTVHCQVGDTESTTSVDVRHYVLPKFSVHAELNKAFYEPGQTVHGTVNVAYFFGKPVRKAAVEVVAESADAAHWNSDTITATTDSLGKAQFDLQLPRSLVGREQDSGDARISLRVTATDLADQKNSETLSRVVTNRPLRIEVVPEGGNWVRDVSNCVYLLASYADGRPAQVNLRLGGHAAGLQTDPSGLATFDFTPQKNDHLKITAIDDRGVTADRDIRLDDSSFDDYLVRLDKAVYDGGDTLRLNVLGRGNEPVFIDLLKDHQTVSTYEIPVTDGNGQSRSGSACGVIRHNRAVCLPIRSTWPAGEQIAGNFCSAGQRA